MRAFGFHFDGDAVVTDPHQSPFWIKALACLCTFSSSNFQFYMLIF